MRQCMTVRIPTSGNEQYKTSMTRASGEYTYSECFQLQIFVPDLSLFKPSLPAIGSVYHA